MRARAPITTSFSIDVPRPTVDSRPTAARSRTNAWSPITTPGPTAAPAHSTAPAHTTAPSPTTRGGSSPSLEAFENEPNAGGFPSTAPSCTTTPAPSATSAWITTFPPSTASSGTTTPSPTSSPGARSDGCSTRRLLERPLQRLQHAHHAQSAHAVRARPLARADAVDEMPALDPQRLLVRDARAERLARARDVLAVRGEV